VDNCEHLLQAAAEVVTAILRAAPGVRVIATSREPLAVPGEHVVSVPPLGLPPPGATEPVAALLRGEAVGLFTERAAAASGSFELTAANQVAVADLCRRLDGLPLAIELAAVRTRVLTVAQILDRLADRFALLTGGSRATLPRHQTLRTTIEWSHDLLTDGERAVLRRCCVFAGRFTLADVEAVCCGGGVPVARGLDVIASLVGKSLVTKEEHGGLACYRLHESMREYAGLKLAASGERQATELRCADHYRASCRRAVRDRRYRLPQWLDWADLEIDNVRAVLQRCLRDGDIRCGTELAASLGWFWITRATTEGMRWLGQFLDAGGGPPEMRAWACFLRGFLAVLKADPSVAVPGLREAVAAARRTGQEGMLVEALSMGSIAENMAGDRAAARRLIAEAQAAESPEYPPGLAAVLQARAFNGFFVGDLDEVRAAASQAAAIARAAGDLYTLEIMLLNLGSAALRARDLGEAKPLITEALTLAQRIDDRVGQLYLVDAFGCHAAFTGTRSSRPGCWGPAAETLRGEAKANFMPFLLPLLTDARQAASAGLGAARFETEFAAGQRLDRERAVELALGTAGGGTAGGGTAAGAPPRGAAGERGGRAARGGAVGPLGKREAEVARLVADGLTNRQIGARLFISERTVDSHVRNILTKLGFGSRAQIAAWLASEENSGVLSAGPRPDGPPGRGGPVACCLAGQGVIGAGALSQRAAVTGKWGVVLPITVTRCGALGDQLPSCGGIWTSSAVPAGFQDSTCHPAGRRSRRPLG
jgi:predicted ATPase/DNA-binding CsgD family transcriptional regulator